MSGERAFSFFQGASEMIKAGAGAGTRARASRTALKIRCKSFSEYLGTLVAVGEMLATRGFIPKSLAGWSDNLASDLRGGEKLGRAIEGVTEGRSWWGRLWPWIDVFLKLISSKTLFQTSWLTH